MKAHAVPQDIMNLEFKLFGNFLSLREFIFIAAGVALAWFFYFLMQNGILPPLLAIPAILFFGLGGIMIGLVPIQDRPLDQWIINYISAIRKPTQRVWKKPGFQFTQTTDNTGITVKDHVVAPPAAQSPSVFTAGVQQQPKQADTATIEAEQDETSDISRIQETIEQIESGRPSGKAAASTVQASAAQGPPAQQRQLTPAPRPGQAVPQTTAAPSTNPYAAPAQQTLSRPEPKPLEPGQPQTVSSAQQPVNIPQTKTPPNNIDPTNTMAPKKNSKMIRPGDLKTSAPNKKAPPQPVPPQNQSHPASEPVKSLTIDDENIKDYTTSITGLEPQKNTINIVVKDTNGLILPGVVCVIKNPKGDPVRAAISNVLGQVLNNVPLKDSTYAVSLSKQGYVFPEIIRTLKGKVYPPIEIKSL